MLHKGFEKLGIAIGVFFNSPEHSSWWALICDPPLSVINNCFKWHLLLNHKTNVDELLINYYYVFDLVIIHLSQNVGEETVPILLSVYLSPSCPLYKSYNWRIFFKLGSNVHLNKAMCRTHVALLPAQGQGHTWRSNIRQSNIEQYIVSAW